MLLLQRQVDQRVRIRVGSVDCWVRVASVDGSYLTLAFEAPPEVEIDREERLAESDRGPCSKLAHATEAEANAHIRSLRLNRKSREGDGSALVAYLCSRCLAYHVGHQTRRSRRRAERRG
jgi:sRNA-binding carbon storage regulator CsrA